MRTILFLALSGVLINQAANLTLPDKPKSVKFAFIGDGGTGDKPEFETAQQMTLCHGQFPFDFVLMLGDNIYGHEAPSDFQRKFAEPYSALLAQGVKFYASLGNHDGAGEQAYKPFNMGGKRYYDFKKGNAEFFALDSNAMDPDQLDWLNKQLADSKSPWKICFFHHPLYSDGRMHGPDLSLRRRLEPVLEQYGVNVVLAGHEHFYERTQPHNGIHYFILGNSGQLRFHNVKMTPDVAKSFDTDRAFALMEIDGNTLHFQVISRTGATVDQGALTLPPPKAAE